MLCKTTMRAALAHVLGTVGLVGAFGAGAAPDDPYATESLTGMSPYVITATPIGDIVIDATIDTLLEDDGTDETFYLVINLWDVQLKEQVPLTYTAVRQDTVGDSGTDVGAGGTAAALVAPKVGDGTGFRFYTVVDSVQGNPAATPAVTAVDGQVLTCGDSTGQGSDVLAMGRTFDAGPAANPCAGAVTLVRAFRGDGTDTQGVYKMELAGDIPIDTKVRVALGKESLQLTKKTAKTYYGDVYIYESLSDARAAARATSPDGAPNTHLVHEQDKLFEVRSKIAKPTVAPMLATADVGYERPSKVDAMDNLLVSNGGPFRGFEGTTRAEKDVGVLAMITLNQVMDSNPAPGDQGFLDVATGGAFDGNPNTGARVKVEAAAGAFGFGNGAGTNLPGPRGESKIEGDNPATPAVEDDHTLNAGGAPEAFNIATGMDCSGGTPLVLSAPGADGNPVPINPLADNPTFSASATEGNATVSGEGPFYLCVMVSENEVAIPVVGDDRDMDGYKITVTPLNGMAAGPATADANGGSIDRNGTTVNITYLSAHEAYNQRLVVVNRGTREAEFWMDEFQTESGTMVMNEIRGTVAAKSRMVIRIQDMLMVNEGGMPRASGTLNLTAPEGEIDVMTLQVHPGTGQIDTTVY